MDELFKAGNTVDIVIHVANIGVLLGGLWAILKIAVPAGLAVRDGLRDTAQSIKTMREDIEDHEDRLRSIENPNPWHGIERRIRRHRGTDGGDRNE